MSDRLKGLAKDWKFQQVRRNDAANVMKEIEEEIASILQVPHDMVGTRTHGEEGLEIKITGKMNHKVDQKELHELAERHNKMDVLNDYYRINVSLDVAGWKKANQDIVKALSPTSTSKPAKLSFKIDTGEK